jgi:competence protein ComGC
VLVVLVCLSVLLLLGAGYLALRLRRSSAFNREAIARNKALKRQVRSLQAGKQRLKDQLRALRAEGAGSAAGEAERPR